jgi:alkanesulfonate monooxygenase SsuD/methylene tetrahydromethanopterin reductase-like flavin-dependent oxidoreductase (luciferase family)
MGVGLGADPRFADVVGIPPAERPGRLREAVEILRKLWTEDDVDYEGEYYRLDGVTVEPKPAQGTLDIWIGGNSDVALKRVARYGDGWFPSSIPAREFAEKLDRLMGYCEEFGRAVERDEAGMILRTHVDPDPDRAREIRDRYLECRDSSMAPSTFEESSAFGTPGECVETIRRYVDAGCTKFVLLPVGPVSERVDQLERYSRDVIPAAASSK